MENASKALLIAAGIFLAVLLISLLVGLYNQISEFYAQQHDLVEMEQTQKFNARFENYNRDDIRGSDLISLMNRVIDYNATESYFEGTGYERIKVTITLVKDGESKDEIFNQFKYETGGSTSTNQYLTKTITNTTGTGINWKDDKNLIAITNTTTNLCAKLESIGVRNPTDAQLQQLSSNISNIIIDENQDWAKSYRFKRADIIEDVLGIEVKIDPTTGKTKTESKDIINKIKEIASQYYQYTQYKRAYFDCTEMLYDEETNRVVEIKFEVKKKNGVVVFN